MSRELFLDVAKKLGQRLTPTEVEQTTLAIEKSTFVNHGSIGVPATNNGDFHFFSDSIRADTGELSNRVVDLFRQGKDNFPEWVYVLTEQSPGVYKFNFGPFKDQVLPTIIEDPTPSNFLVSDTKTATITFHHEGTIFWRKIPQE